MPRRGRSRGWGTQQDSGETVSDPSSSQPTSGETGVETSGSAVVDEGGSTPSPGPSTTGTGDKKKSTKTEDQKTKVVKQWKKMKIKTNNSSSGSPWDRVTRKQINVNILDLGTSYVGLLKQSSEGKKKKFPPRQTRWQHTGHTPLTDVESLPADWNANEPDLDPKDIDAQIIRCEERIEDNIMTWFFEKRLKTLRKQKEYDEALHNGEPEGLDGNVYKRLESLKYIQKELQSNGGDKYHQLQNVEAILQAYRSKRLSWNRLVTYWSKGKQLCEPRPFDMDEFEAINVAHEGHEAFWVEGFMGPGPARCMATLHMEGGAENDYVINYTMAARIPGFDWWHEIEFMYDTGASLMNLWESDIETLLGPFHPGGAGIPIPELPVLGTLGVSTLLGTTIRAVLRIEVAILRADGKRMTPWTKIPFYLMEGDAPPGGVRCDGPIMRHLLFMTHTPDNSGKAIASTSKLAFNMTNSVPMEQRKIDYGRSSMRNDILVAPPGTQYKTVYNWYDLPNPAYKRPMPEAARRVP